MLYSRVLSHLGQSPCAQIHLLCERGSSFAGGPIQRVHCKGSQVLSECCTLGYSATLARTHVHRYICSMNGGWSSGGLQTVRSGGSGVGGTRLRATNYGSRGLSGTCGWEGGRGDGGVRAFLFRAFFFFAQFITFGVRHRALHGGNHQLALVAWAGLY